MEKYISLGEYNKLYKHIWYYLITKLIYEYLLNSFFVEKVELLKDVFPINVLIQGAFNYLGLCIFSLFLHIYEVKQKKVGRVKSMQYDNSGKKPLAFNKNEQSHLDVYLIYNDLMENNYMSISDFMVIILLYFCIQFFIQFFLFKLRGLDYYMFELLFIALVNLKLNSLPIYKHRKFGILFIVIFCTLFKILSTIFRFIDDKDKKIYTKYVWIVPLGIIFFISITCLRAYIFVKIKFICDKKFILPSNILFLYSFFGAFVSFIISIIPTNIPCTDASFILSEKPYTNLTIFKNDLIQTICQVKEDNSTILYYESYSIYFKELLKNNFLMIILFMSKIVLYFSNKLFYLYVIKDLGAEYILCANSIFYIITEIIDFCYFLFNQEKFRFYKFFGMIAQIFSFIGTLIYLELIELHFCELDHNLKKNIKERAIGDEIMELEENLPDEEITNKGSQGSIY